MKYLLSTFLLNFLCFLPMQGFSQESKFELLVGVHTSTINHLLEGQQRTYPYKLNAPYWRFGMHAGVNRKFSFNDRLGLSIGLRLQMRGDRDSRNIIAPEIGLDNNRMWYAMMPISLSYKLLPTKGFYLKGGIAPDFLLFRNRAFEGPPVFPLEISFLDKLGLTGQIGFRVAVNNRFDFEIMFSESLIPFYSLATTNVVYTTTYKHQAFEFTTMYKL